MPGPVDSSDPTRKPELRILARRRRRSMAPMDRARADEAIIAHLLKAIERTSPLSIGAFLGFDGEPDLRPLLEQLHGANLRLALPVIHPTRPGIMNMHEWTPATPLQQNRYGIDEPRGTPLIQATDLDWALLPLAAFDADGTRQIGRAHV